MADKNKDAGAAVAGVAGAIIGAAATAAAIALADEKNRKKAEGILKDLQKQGNKVIKEITKRAMELKDLKDKALPEAKEVKKTSKKKTS